ncbi:MAG: hypothetical protein H5T97_08565, partial [Firmicutes bacterium]|nr:hypothetical protein [Bacillota bacterium]
LAGLRGELLARARELERLQLTLAVVADHGRRVTRRLMDIAAHLAPEDRKDPSMVNVVV